MLDVVLNAFAMLFVTIDPPGILPIFVSLTLGRSAVEQRRIAIQGIGIGAAVMIGFALIGATILELLGIGLPAFRIAGGLMLLWIAFEMVFEKRSDRRSRSAKELANHEPPEDIAVFPLAIPLIAGPGAITSILLLMGQHDGDLLRQAVVLAVLMLVLGLCLLILLIAAPLARVLGPTTTAVISRLLGILLAALAIQFVLDGLRAGLQTAA